MFERDKLPVEMRALLDMVDDGLVMRDAAGHEMLAVALFATVYFAEPWKREVREVVARFAEDYMNLWSDHLRWALNPRTLHMDAFSGAEGIRPTDFSALTNEDSALEIMAYGAAYERGASAVHVTAYGPRALRPDKVGFLRLGCPLLPVDGVHFHLPGALLDLCKKLNPVSGYGVLGMIPSPDRGDAQDWEGVLFELSKRFPGLEMEFTVDHCISLRQGRDGGGGIKGAAWLTVIGDVYLAELGGADAVKADLAALDPRFVIRRYDGGVLIQAGDRPVLGDAERNAWPELYIKLAKYLKPIRITEHCPFGSGWHNWAFGPEQAKAWLRRYDDR